MDQLHELESLVCFIYLDSQFLTDVEASVASGQRKGIEPSIQESIKKLPFWKGFLHLSFINFKMLVWSQSRPATSG
jgi:hypothetical protein